MDRFHPWQPFIMYAPIYLYSNIVDNHKNQFMIQSCIRWGDTESRDFKLYQTLSSRYTGQWSLCLISG